MKVRRGRIGHAVFAAALLAAACRSPLVGDPVTKPAAAGVTTIALTAAWMTGTNPDHVVAKFRITQDGKGVDGETAARLAPRFTLAALDTDPVSNLPAWKSLILTGAQTLAQLPVDGPGTLVLTNTQQPGAETSGVVEDLGDGFFLFTFANEQSFAQGATLRVGVWLDGIAGTKDTSATLDFVDFTPGGAAPLARDTVLDDNCKSCHGLLRGHLGKRAGVKLCLTCHTYLHADPDTVDPAALDGATGATNPNPLDLGRLVHRIHRGKWLPTLYQSTSTAVPAPALPSSTALPLPFFPGRNPPVAGRMFSIVGDQSREFVAGQIAERIDNANPPYPLAIGITFPRDLRDCDACHAGAPQASAVTTEVSRRTCQGCHPDVWFGTDPIADLVHFAHPGGPQGDDTKCKSCHVPTTTDPGVYPVPISEIHVPPYRSLRYDPIEISISEVQNFLPGQHPTIVFRLSDRNGALDPPNAPSPPTDATSPVPRALESLRIAFSGPTAPDYASDLSTPVSENAPLTIKALTTGAFSYTMTATVPANATGTWAIAMEARRNAATVQYDTATGKFLWPYTGERLYETARVAGNDFDSNPVVYVDVSVGTLPGGSPTPRRAVVEQKKCMACHGRLSMHGELRHSVEMCVMCHTPERTDWARRPKDPVTKNVLLAGQLSPTLWGTYDDIEERSIHFKAMIHRIHTGDHVGAASLDLVQPFYVYGYPGGSAGGIYFGEIRFPNDLRNCDLCHLDGTWRIDAIPADAAPTIANETPTIQHQATADHVQGEPQWPPIQAACMSCHDTGVEALHAASHTVSGVEQCASCHLRGALSVDVVHGLSP